MKTGKMAGIGILGWIAATLSLMPTFALAGSGAHGGDPINVRVTLISEFINTELRSELLNLIEHLNMATLPTPLMKRAIQNMIDHDLALDIRTSGYDFRNVCRDHRNRARAATAIRNDLGGRICFNPLRLAREHATKSEIVALAFHEHAHHFGEDDVDASIQRAIFQQVALNQPEWHPLVPTSPAPAPVPAPTATRSLVERLISGETLLLLDHARGLCDYQIRYDSNTRAVFANQTTSSGGAWHRTCANNPNPVRNVLCSTDLREGAVCEWNELEHSAPRTFAHSVWSNRSHMTFTFSGSHMTLVETRDEERCTCYEWDSQDQLMCWASRCPVRRTVNNNAIFETN